MAKFLTTTAVSYHIENIINQAEDWLVIISPYLRVNSRIQTYIQNKCWNIYINQAWTILLTHS